MSLRFLVVAPFWASLAIGQIDPDCSSLKWMMGSEIILRDVTIADVLPQLAPKSKLFYSDDGLLAMDQSGFWYFLNREQNVIVRLRVQSGRWRRFQSSILEETSIPRPLTLPFRYGRLPSEHEKCALLRLIQKLSTTFCYLTSEKMAEALKKGLGRQVVDFEALKRKAELAAEERQRKSLAEQTGGLITRKRRVIYYNGELALIDGNNHCEALLEWIADQNTLVGIQRLLRETRYALLEGSGLALPVSLNGRPVARLVPLPPGFHVPADELARRGITSAIAEKPSIGIGDLGGASPLEEANNRALAKQYCPFDLAVTIGLGKPSSNVFLIDAANEQVGGSDSLNNWTLFIDKDCYKCGGLERSGESYIVASQLENPIRVQNEIYNQLNPEHYDSLSNSMIDHIGLAVKWRLSDRHDTTLIRAIGEGGMSFRDRNGNLVILGKNQRMVFCNPQSFTSEDFYSWYGITTNGSPLVLKEPATIMEMIFDFTAMGRGEWRRYFRQDPMAFGKKYCTIERLNKEDH
jgi:hypothetical protein